jgi:DNA-binding MarR family transcriptional regulator
LLRHYTTRTVYAFVWHYYQEHGYSPTHQEIADGCGVARSGVSRHLDKLARWGWVTREDGKARATRPIKPIHEIEYQLPLPKF